MQRVNREKGRLYRWLASESIDVVAPPLCAHCLVRTICRRFVCLLPLCWFATILSTKHARCSNRHSNPSRPISSICYRIACRETKKNTARPVRPLSPRLHSPSGTHLGPQQHACHVVHCASNQLVVTIFITDTVPIGDHLPR